MAAFTSDPDNAMAWYANITTVEWQTPKPAAVGSRVLFKAQMLGRELTYLYEVTALDPGERFVMKLVEGPFPTETTYTWQDTPGGGTRMALRNRGEPSGFSKVTGPFIGAAVRRNTQKDLKRLTALLEAS